VKDQLEQYVKKVKERQEFCQGNEATTKASLIAPLFSLLGWDMTDPRECQPEFRADFGKGEKAATPVDWAFSIHPAFSFIVEAKECSKKLKV
jgi:predicted type IV restriction endonuclease